MKRIVSIILAVALLSAALPMTASAAGTPAEKQPLSGSDIFPYIPEAASFLQRGLRGWTENWLGRVLVPGLSTVLYYLLWPFAKLVHWLRLIFHAGVRGSGGYNYTFAYSTEKILRRDVLPCKETMQVTMGKNERESLQFIVRARKNADYTVEISAVRNANGAVIPVELYKEHYVFIDIKGDNTFKKGHYPDALIPYDGETAGTARYNNQGFYIELRTDANTPAGIYQAVITVKDTESGKKVIEAPFTVEVVHVTFPDKPYSDTVVGLAECDYFRWNAFYTRNGVEPGTAEAEALRKQHFDYLLDHRISGYYLPYDILDPRADEYMSNPRLTAFLIPCTNKNDDQVRAYYDKVQSNPVWRDKGYFYPVDEPYTAGHFRAYMEATDRLTRLCPGYNMVTPFHVWKTESEGVHYDNLATQSGRSSILCPAKGLFDMDGFAQAVESVVEANEGRLWWYVCGSGGLNIHTQGTRDRVLFWQQYQQNVTGFLYWCAAYWNQANPWDDPYTCPSQDTYSTGDGSLFYPQIHPDLPGGRMDEPIPSLRLKHLADGLEDYDLLRMAEEKFGRAYSMEKAAQLSTSLNSYTKDPAKMDCVRTSILRDLAK